MGIYEEIRSKRVSKGLSQEDMANKLGITSKGYAKIERGKTDINLSRLQQIADALEVELPALFPMNEKNIFNYEKEMTYLKEEIAHLKEIIRLMQRSSK